MTWKWSILIPALKVAGPPAATAVIMSEQGCKRLHHPLLLLVLVQGPCMALYRCCSCTLPGWSLVSSSPPAFQKRHREQSCTRWHGRTGSSLVVTSSLSSPCFFRVDTHLLLEVAPSQIPHTTPTNKLHKTEERKKVLNCLLPRWGADQAAGVPGVVAEVGPLPHPAPSVEHQ